MNRVRYEAEIKARSDGSRMVQVHDDYWDSIYTVILNHADAFSVHCADVELFDGASTILPDEPGWYAVEVEDYPFGKPVRAFRIPGRHLRYR